MSNRIPYTTRLLPRTVARLKRFIKKHGFKLGAFTDEAVNEKMDRHEDKRNVAR